MKRIIVIGCPGGGKSTFARALHQKTGIPLYHLDMMNWNEDRTNVPKDVFRGRLQDTIQKDSWIIDGNYGSTIELRLQACDTVFFLDYPVEICLKGVKERRGQKREDLPWVENPDEVDEEFMEFILKYNENSRPGVMELLRKYSDREIITFRSRREAQEYLKGLSKKE